MSIAPEVERYLRDKGVEFQLVHHSPAFTAMEEAAAAHVSGYEWAKTVVLFAGRSRPVMAVLPANFEVDVEELRLLMGEGELRLAQEWEFQELYPGCEPGAMPPLGPLYGQAVYVDRHLAEDEEITFNAGDHIDAVRIRYADFDRLVHPRVGDFARLATQH